MNEKNKCLLIFPVVKNTFLHKSVKVQAQLEYKNQPQMTYGHFKANGITVQMG